MGGRGLRQVGSLPSAQVSSARPHPGPRRRSGTRDGTQGGGRQKSGDAGHRLPLSPLHLPGLSPGPGRLLPPVKNRVVSAAPAAAWRPWVTSPHRSAAALPAAQAGDRPRWQRGPAEGRGAGWPHLEQACWGHFGLGGRVTNSTPSVAESELRQLRDGRCRRRLSSAAGDIGRRPLVTGGGGGGRGAGKGGVGGQKVEIVPGGV